MVAVSSKGNGFLPKIIMASPYLQFSILTTLAMQGGYSENPHLSQNSAVFLLSACLYLRERWLWQNPISPIDDTTYNQILEMIEQAEADLMTSYAVGSIISSICTQTGSNLQLLDGSSLLVSDYPELASCVPASWIVGTDIVLPDMASKGLFGADIPSSVGTLVGENDHTLTESEMPSHTHTQNPHQHTYTGTTITPTAAGLEPALASLVTPLPNVTGQATATNNNTGGDSPHNNVQESLQVFYYLVVR